MDVNQFLDEHKSLLGSIVIHCQKHYGVNVTDADFQMICDKRSGLKLLVIGASHKGRDRHQ